jgi:hypothetical protein
MEIRLNGMRLRELVSERGGIERFLELWDWHGSEKLDRTTIHRWGKGKLPKNKERLMQLCRTLDVDPFALLDAGDGNSMAAMDELFELFQSTSESWAALEFLRPFLGRQKQWPPAEVAMALKREWVVREFTHDPEWRSNYFVTVELSRTMVGISPQVYHFAFRHPSAFTARWLGYGLVIRDGKTATLWHIGGRRQQMEMAEGKPTRVNTWFGQGPAIFKVSSLHDFALKHKPYTPDGGTVLEFPA